MKIVYSSFRLVWACSLLLALGFNINAASRLLPFQGRLTDSQGVIVPDGDRIVQFKIYNAPVGGRAVWNGEVHRLSVNRGLISTLLGSKAALDVVDFNQDLYVELTVDSNGDGIVSLSDPPLLPRQAVLPAVFAIESANSQKLAGYDWTPIFGTNSPTGLISGTKLADGSISGSKLATASISADQIRDGSVGREKLSDGSVTTDKVANGAIGLSQLSPKTSASSAPQNGIATNWFTGTRTWTSSTTSPVGSEHSITNLKVSLVTTGRPVLIMLGTSEQDPSDEAFGQIQARTQSDDSAAAGIRIYRNGDVRLADQRVILQNSSARSTISIPLSSFSHIDHPPAGTNIYEIKVWVPGFAGGDPGRPYTVEVRNAKISVFEIH